MTSATHILGIHDGHNCGASLVSDGVVVASVCEERLTRRKNEVGYPHKSIASVLAMAGVEPAELAAVVYASNFMHKRDYLEELTSWYKVGLKEQRAREAKTGDYEKIIFDERRRERIEDVVDQLGVPADSIHFVEHHHAHLTAAYYTSPHHVPGEPVLGLTCDGAGDGLCATVSICKDNEITRIAQTNRHASLGKIYSRVTFLMGMTPWEHEYKLMGMAPYADPERADRAAEPLRQLLRLRSDGLGFEQVGELSTNYCYEYLRDAFERVRFDTITGATQAFTEEMLVAWVKACIAHTGIRRVVAGGGVFMNVKANMLLADLPEVDKLYVMPSAGDESLSIGAALSHYYNLVDQTDHTPSVLTNLYLGDSVDPADERRAIDGIRGRSDLAIDQSNDMERSIAELLAAGEIVATCRGRMEWGARALGNRSILCGADDPGRVETINRMIKMRDFWMPFAPSIKEESKDRYFDDPKDLKPWFMTMAFRARDEGYDDLRAGSHPRDKTVRPQVVRKSANPRYHSVIDGFEKLTGRGVVLNTSFNLHGEPIVRSPEDALRVFMNSGLTHLALDNFLVSKKAA